MTTMTKGAEAPAGRGWTRAERHLTIGGLLGIGVSFGFARYGYGLFLPDIRREFDLSVTVVGLIASATYVGYLLAVIGVGVYARRLGPRVLVGVSSLTAVTGMALVVAARGLPLLTVGLLLAGTSCAWAWAPYSDAVDLVVTPARRERVLSIVPAGTAVGTAVVGPLALVAHGDTWRVAWIVMTALAAVVGLYNVWAVPRRPAVAGAREVVHGGGRWWWPSRASVPLYAVALSYGVIGSFYWNFATESISRASSGPLAVPSFWTVMGVAGVLGVFAGVPLSRLGIGRTSALLFGVLAVSIALLGLGAGSTLVADASAVLYGPAYMAVSSVLAVWSYQVFPERPTTGFTATLMCLGAGTVLGPATLGALADAAGLRTAFLLTAGIALATVALRPARTRPGAARTRESVSFSNC